MIYTDFLFRNGRNCAIYRKREKAAGEGSVGEKAAGEKSAGEKSGGG